MNPLVMVVMVIVVAYIVGHLLRRLDRHTGTFLHMLLLFHLAAALLRDRAARLDRLADWLVGAGLAGDGLAGGGGAVAVRRPPSTVTTAHLVMEVTVSVCLYIGYIPFHS